MRFRITPASPRLPPLTRRLRNATAAAIAVGKGAVAGEFRVTREERALRENICRTQCPEWHRPSDHRCAHPACGCWLRLKTWLSRQACPAGFWADEKKRAAAAISLAGH